jgi:peptidoglycan/xylan/chitin deacetylase (PgdA/CDA1 family)
MNGLRCLIPNRVYRRRLDPATTPRVLLTFDDGPTSDVTPAVLERLARYNARAMFFVVGKRLERAPDMVARVIAAGHEVGNHSFSHVAPRPFAVRSFRQDLQRCQLAIESLGGQPRWFRPPLGRMNPATLLAPRYLGLQRMGWSLETNDWRCRSVSDARATADALLKSVIDRDIVLLHDDHPRVLDILDCVLPTLSRRFDLAVGQGACRCGPHPACGHPGPDYRERDALISPYN